mmetsp:Transcript_807/g.2490  ORF Transcript_807/g.2490 Transcript_807/m.2490 type:complete len:335 (+) Transcript_807:475-1479(+)|eukprot:CAMPEP_0206137446 /NCGR_PEP_ID=MMETSP1473-20131121/2564_1 /ASSEMBLY_ACC=CAM_ASM_001109 /TAXON_ID=1461547 /ORGANISM="Stichococcus sp, Strain RCC1054" /LENGTH=334 /DNA_ID=CAMNT_0053530523 /DNA_START=380 /DNA_END=1384 /DNA_ORIENTATION=+
MSSLAAARADNFYYPPTWDPKKGGLTQQATGQHPLRERARKLDQGILIIRFEMPFNVWCEKCNHLIGTGVRFNAEKKQIGNYHTTKIWSFTMRAPCCQNRIEIHTDPKNTRYNIVSGARQKVETWTAADAETMELPDSKEKPDMSDPFARMEHGEEDRRQGRRLRHRLVELRADADIKFGDDYAANKALRNAMRSRRKEAHATFARHKALGLPEDVPLAPQSEDDTRRASLVTFGDDRAFEKARRFSRDAIRSSSIFSAPPDRASASGSHSASRLTGRPVMPPPSAVSRLAKTAGGAVSKPSLRALGNKKQSSAADRRKRLLGLNVKLSLSNPS